MGSLCMTAHAAGEGTDHHLQYKYCTQTTKHSPLHLLNLSHKENLTFDSN